MIFQRIQADAFEQVIFCNDPSIGLKAIISLHSLVLGPALGGCRMWNYASEAEALNDVLRLSQGMTYKASISGLHRGGGKAVIIGDPKRDKSDKILERFGQFVDRLNGNYITAKDVGIGADDLRVIKRQTAHVLGIDGDRGSSNDPSPLTALGVYQGMRACARVAFKADSLDGLTVALQGLGSVSYYLLDYLTKAGAKVIACDIDAGMVERAVKKFNIQIVPPDSIVEVKCDIFSPSALGAAINTESIRRLQTRVVAGAANNQLATSEDGYELLRRKIIYAPDYAINAGGLINIYYEDPINNTYDQKKAFDHVTGIGNTIQEILERADAEGLPTHIVADRMAEDRILRARGGVRKNL